jgi:hypothetical protein
MRGLGRPMGLRFSGGAFPVRIWRERSVERLGHSRMGGAGFPHIKTGVTA